MTLRLTKFLILALVLLFGASFAYADSVTDSNIQFTATVSGNTVTLDIQCLDTNVCGNWYLGDVSLKGFTFTGTPTLGTAPSGYTLMNGGQNNSAVGNGGGCNGTQTGGAVCWDAPTVLSTQLGGSILEFTATISNGVAGALHVQATGYSNTAGTQAGGGKVFAVSDDLAPTTVPEPSALVLLFSGLLALGLFRIFARA